MPVLSHQVPMPSVARTNPNRAGAKQAATGVYGGNEVPRKKRSSRLTFERFSSLARETNSFFSRLTDG